MAGESLIVLEVDGQIMSGWTNVSVSHSLDNLCRTFSFDVSGDVSAVRDAVTLGSACSVYAVDPYGKEYALVTGYVENISRGVMASGETMNVSGRDKTCDLVDCVAEVKSSTWRKQKFSKICSDLCSGFGITVYAVGIPADPQIEQFTLQQGEAVFAAIERLARFVGVVPFATTDGRLMFVTAGDTKSPVSLELGKNIVDVGYAEGSEDRFSEYKGKGVRSGRGQSWTVQDLQMKATATDPGVTRYRPMVLLAESKTEKALLEKRIRWEAQIRAGRSRQYSVLVRDFFQFTPSGAIVNPWTVNELVDLIVPRWNLQTELLISGVDFAINNGGRTTSLTLRDPRTYAPDPSEQVTIE